MPVIQTADLEETWDQFVMELTIIEFALCIAFLSLSPVADLFLTTIYVAHTEFSVSDTGTIY